MMRKFELCFDFEGQVDQTFLIPDLLPKTEPETGDWDRQPGVPLRIRRAAGQRDLALYRADAPVHRANVVWRTGVVLALEENDETHALVRANYAEDRIYISVRGPAYGRRELLTRIREQLDAIHHTIQGLQTAEKIPLPGHPKLPPVDYRWLRDMERKGIPEFLPPGLTEPLNVHQLLDGVEPLTTRRARDTKYEVHIHGGQVGVIGDRPEVKNGIHFESNDD